MSHVDKKNNQKSKKTGKKTKEELYKLKEETANEIGVSKGYKLDEFHQDMKR